MILMNSLCVIVLNQVAIKKYAKVENKKKKYGINLQNMKMQKNKACFLDCLERWGIQFTE